MPHYFRKAEQKRAFEHCKLSGMVKGSSNYEKQKQKIAMAFEKVCFQRKDWIEKESRRMANSYDAVCVEDLDLKNVSQCLHLRKSTLDNAFGLFRTKLNYKLAEQGKNERGSFFCCIFVPRMLLHYLSSSQ